MPVIHNVLCTIENKNQKFYSKIFNVKNIVTILRNKILQLYKTHNIRLSLLTDILNKYLTQCNTEQLLIYLLFNYFYSIYYLFIKR